METWSPDWTISFEIKPTGVGSFYTSILHMTTEGDQGTYGFRIPALWFLPGSRALHITCDYCGDTSAYHTINTEQIPWKWTTVEISHRLQTPESSADGLEGWDTFDSFHTRDGIG